MTWQIVFKPKNKYGWWRIISSLVVAFTALAAVGMGYFIYQNTYTTLANANIIITLNSTLNVDIIDAKAHEDARQAIALKNSAVNIPIDIKYIFAYAATSTNAAPAAKKTLKK